MCFGAVPEPEVLRCFEISLVLYAEHSFNASTFTARVVTYTLSDLYSAVTATIGALKGPLHGGANEAVMHMLEATDRFVARLAESDPAVTRLAELHAVLRRERFARKEIHPNLDYPAGLAYHLMGFDIPAFTPIFVMSRITGWTAHITEQMDHNSLIRPLASYDGRPSARCRQPPEAPMFWRVPGQRTGYGTKVVSFSSMRRARPSGGTARCGQASRSQVLQPRPIGVAADSSARSSPAEYTSREACRSSQPRPMAKTLPGRPQPPGERITVRAVHR
jgi:hypothetical protein